MSGQPDEIGKRYSELRADRVSSKDACQKVNKEFGTNHPVGAITKYASRYKKRLESGLLFEQGEHSEDNELSTSPVDNSDVTEKVINSPGEFIHSAEVDNHIREIAREVFAELFQNLQNERNIIAESQDMPPEPETIKKAGKGRRENRDYVKMSVTVDRALWEIFEKERARLKVSSGRMMDILLWRAFGKPKLSYQPSEH
jgi:hypothetical protein